MLVKLNYYFLFYIKNTFSKLGAQFSYITFIEGGADI